MVVIDGKDLESAVFFDQNPLYRSSPHFPFPTFFYCLLDFISGFYCNRILINLDFHVLRVQANVPALVKKIGIDFSNSFKFLPLILNGLRRE